MPKSRAWQGFWLPIPTRTQVYTCCQGLAVTSITAPRFLHTLLPAVQHLEGAV